MKDLEKKYHKIIENANEIKKILPDKKIQVTNKIFFLSNSFEKVDQITRKT